MNTRFVRKALVVGLALVMSACVGAADSEPEEVGEASQELYCGCTPLPCNKWTCPPLPACCSYQCNFDRNAF